MAERVDKMPESWRGPDHKYPWDEWLDGSVWELIEGKDFKSRTSTMRNAAIYMANHRGIKIKVHIRGDRVYIQAERPDN